MADTHITLGDNIVGREYYFATDLEAITGIPASSWRYYAWAGQGPPSFKLGRRRVWSVDEFQKWLAEQQQADSSKGNRD